MRRDSHGSSSYKKSVLVLSKLFPDALAHDHLLRRLLLILPVVMLANRLRFTVDGQTCIGGP